MTDSEKREAARKFHNTWKERTDEKQDGQSFWRALLTNVMDIKDVESYVEFERRVQVDGQQKYIDAYIPATKVLIEQKSGNKDLSKPEPQAGGLMLTPYQQGKRYANNMPLNQMPRYIVACNFHEFWIYDQNKPGQDPEIVRLDNLPNEYHRLEFLVKQEHVSISQEMQLSIKAGELVGKIHDRFLTQYNDPLAKHTQRSLNILCVRIVFCLYAEDAGLFGAKDAFHKYIEQYEPKDIRRALIDLFQVLDTPLDQRADLYLADDLAAFPYVNGGLFAEENIVIPKITPDIKQTLLESSQFDWSKISPTIFGAVFESTLNPETRRAGGMHYTSIANIHKVIDPLFLDELREELASIADIAVPATQKKRLNAFQEKIAGLKFLDPACGSGNFLTETYLSLRRLENEVLRLRIAADRKVMTGQIVFGFEEASPIKVSIGQFYGIEINDFAVAVARTALWIAESQMLKETEDIVHTQIDFLPLKSYVNIVEGNALRIDWNRVIDRNQLSYIMGNPPFVGTKMMGKAQKEDTKLVIGAWKNYGTLDYVSCWYKVAADYIKSTDIRCAFVSTNSICQGEQVANMWEPLLTDGIHMDFAYRTFYWDSEASIKAHVHCVIIGFSRKNNNSPKSIFEGEKRAYVQNINPYLVSGETVFVKSLKSPISKEAPTMYLGCDFKDDGNYVLTLEEKDNLITQDPGTAQFIRPYMMGKDFINRKYRYCIWLKDVDISEARKYPVIIDRIRKVQDFRRSCPSPDTNRYAEKPMLPVRLCYYSEGIETDVIALPKVSSQNRRYIPMDILKKEVIAGCKLFLIPYATRFQFGILMSNVHMAWMRTVCGRLKSDYSYSSNMVYNTFPWPDPTEEQRKTIEQTAQGILDARALYPDASLADLYDPLTMPVELRQAHGRNDAAVMRAYGFSVKDMSEADCVAALMRMYQELITNER